MIKEYAEFERKRRDGNPNEEKRSSVRKSYSEFIKNNPTSGKPKTSEKDDIRYKTSSLPAPFQVAEKMRENVTDAMDKSKPVVDAAYTIGKLAHQETQAEQKRIASLPLPLQYAEKLRTSAIKATDTALKQPVISDVHNSAVEQYKTNQIRQSILENGKRDKERFESDWQGKNTDKDNWVTDFSEQIAQHGKRKTQIKQEYNYLDEETMAEIKIMAEGLNAEPMTKGLTGIQVAMFGGEEYGKAYQRTVDAEEARKRLVKKGYSKLQVDTWAEMMQNNINQEYREDMHAGWAELAEDHPVIASAASVGQKFMTMPLDVASKLDEAAAGKIETNGLIDTVAQSDEMLRSAVSEDIAEDSEIGAWLYNVGMSGIDSAVASVMPGGHLFLAADAATSTMRDLTNRGVSAEKAFFGGLAAGVFEGLFEKVSIGNFKSLQEVSPLGVKDVVKNVLKSTGVNASEEAATELANIIYDTVMHGDSSQFNQLVEKYNGDKARAFADLALQVGEAGLSGAAMGSGFGVTGSAIGYASNYGDIKATGQQVKAEGLADTVLEQGKTAPEKSRPYQAYNQAQKKLDKGKSLSDRDVGLVALESSRYIQENAPELNGVFESAKTLEDVEALYNTERYRIQNSPLTPQESKSAIKALDADYKTAKTSLERFNKSGARAMSEGVQRTMTETDTVKTKMPAIGKTDAGEVISVSSIENIEDGNITVKTSEGATQELNIKKDIKSVDAQTLWTNATQNFTDAESAQAFIDNYDGGSIADYTKAFKDYYHLAATGMSLDDINKHEIAPYYNLSEQAQIAAVELGQKAISYQQGVFDLTAKPKSKAQQLQVSMLDSIGKHIGMNVVVVDNMSKYEGFYRSGTNQIVIALDSSSGAILRTAGHETYHFVKEKMPDKTGDIENFVLDTLKKNKGEKWVNDRLKFYEKQGYKTKEAQVDELVADSLFDVFTSKRAVKDFATENQSLAKKLVNHIQKLVSDIKNIINKLLATGDYAEIKAWQDDVASLEKLNDMFLNVLDELAAKKADNTVETKNTPDEVLIIPSSVRFTDKQRAELFEKIYIEPVDIAQEHISQTDVEALQSKYKKDAKDVIKSLIEKFETDGKTLYKKYSNDNIDLEFYFGSRRMSESLNKQNKNYYYFAQMLLNFEELVTKAVPIESHSDKYKSTRRQDNSLKQTYVLMSALKESKNSYVPIQFEIKEFIDKQNSLYVAIALNKIEVDVSGQTSDKRIGENNPRSTSEISIADIIRNINPIDASFIKYAPDDLLNAKQKEAKEKALVEEQNKIEKYRAEADETNNSATKISMNRNVEKTKQSQLDIINKTNPVPNSYSTWIRTVDDIKTLPETLEDSDWDYEEFNPDLTRTDIRNAIESGKITVYSSYPISNGVFVSPSRMEAESYSGNGKIYEKTVDINDVAWIDPTQGQLAKVEENKDDIWYSSKRTPPNLDPNKPRTPGKKLIESPLTDSGKINYNYEEHDPLSFDDRAKPNSKSSINWVYKAEIFSTVENKMFHQKLAEIKQGSDAFVQTEDGEYIIPIENKLVFTNGDFDTPYVREIFEVITEHSTNFEKVKDVIVDEARGRAGHREAVQLVKQVFGDGLVLQYKSNADGAYGWADRKPKGRNRRAAINNYINQQYRKRNASKSGTNQSVTPSTKRESSISEEASNYILDTKEYQEVLGVLERRFNTLGKVKLSPKAIDRYAGKLLQKSKSNYSREQLTERLTALFDFIANSRDVTWEEVTELAANIAKDMLSESQTLDRSMQNEYSDVLKLMRESRVYISPEVRAEINHNFGSLEAFRRRLGGKLKITVTDESAVPLDVFWRELAEDRPEMFEADINHLDMPSKLIDFFEMTSPQYINPYNIEMDMDEAAYDFALQMYDEYFEIPEVKTEAQKYAAKLEMLKGRYNAKIREIHNSYRERIKEIRTELKAENKNQIAATKELYRSRNEKYRNKQKETRDKQRLRAQIYRSAQSLTDKLVNPTDQKHIPQELISAVNDFCRTITESGVFTPDRANKLRKAFKSIGENSVDPDANLSTMYNEEIAEMLEQLHDAIAGRRLGELNINELARVKIAASYFTHIVSMSNRTFSDNIKEKLLDLQSNAIFELDKIPPDRKRVKFEIQKGLLKPVTFFELLESPTLMKLYENIRQGEGKWYNTIASAKKRRQEAAKKYDYKSWQNDKITFKPERLDGEIVLSVGEALSIYATANREQGVEHIRLGGIVREEDAKKKLKSKDKAKSVDVRSENIPLTVNDMVEITSQLTKEQKAYADNLIEFMSKDMAALGNEVSMRLFGIKKFNETKYFPLKSASNFLYSKPAVENDARIKHMSMTKQTTPKANNPVVIGDFTETVMNHCNDMALYYAFCLPLEDFNRVYNFKTQPTMFERSTSIKQKIDRAYGSKANGYIKQLLTDINGGVTQQAGTGFVNKMISLAKKNAVFASLSVAVQQPSAVARAFLYIDPKYFVSSTFTKRDWNELKKYAPVAGVKEMGYFDTNIGKQSVDWMTEDGYDGLKEKAVALLKDKNYRDDALSFLPSYMDRITWGHIWNAVKKETAHNNPDVDVKSEEFLKLAGERFTYVIDRTQVYDSVFARSEWMRSKDTGVKVATAFMSEPLTNYNMLYSAAVKARHGDKKFAAKAVSAYLVSVAFNSILKSLVTAGRDDDEDKSYWEKYISHLVGSFIDEPFGMIPYLKDFISLMQGYDSKRMDTQALADIAAAAVAMFDDDKSGWEKFKSSFGAVGIAAGIPFKNLIRDGEMIYRGVKDIFDGKKQPTTAKGVGYAIKGELGLDVPNQTEQLVEAYLEGDTAHYDKVKANIEEEIVANSKNGDVSEEDLASEVNSKIKSATRTLHKERKITKEQASKILKNLLDLEEDDIYWQLQKWDNAANDDWSKYGDFYSAIDSNKNVRATVKSYIDHGVTTKTLASEITKHYKEEYINLYKTDRVAASKLKSKLIEVYVLLGYKRTDKSKDIDAWLKPKK